MSRWQDPVDITAVRDELGLTQAELADLLGVSLRTIQSCEQGWRRPSPALEKSILLHLMICRHGDSLSGQACWEEIDCPDDIRSRCPVYQARQGHLCWFLTGNKCLSQERRMRSWSEKKAVCRQCSFFRQLMRGRAPE